MNPFSIKPIFVLILSLMCATSVKANWVDLNTGIGDDLTGIVFRGNTGVVSGHGLYFTTNGGAGSSSWTRYEVIGNPADSVLYENTHFLHCFSEESDVNNVFACGVDIVQNKAVIFQFSLVSFTHTVLYVGPSNSQLNNIGFSAESNDYVAVGSNGLIVQFDAGVTPIIHSTSLTQDLKSISFFSDQLWIGADNYEILGTDDNPGITITTINPAPLSEITDVLKTSVTQGIGAGNTMFTQSGSIVSSSLNYDYQEFLPLDASCVYHTNNVYFVGTPHGIFRTASTGIPSSSNPFEIQLTSLQKDIQEFWSSPTLSGDFYACGKNGVILKSNIFDLGGETKPYVAITQSGSGGCENAYTYFTGLSGSSTSCYWYVDGNYAGSNCNGLSEYFSAPGSHTIMLIGNNTFGTDTAYYNQVITAIPQVNKPTSLFDSILCHSEPVDVFVDSSEVDVYYSLYDFANNTNFGSSVSGNGSTLNFTTSNVFEEGYYYLLATSSINSNCFNSFTDSIFIEVEKTHADFHVSHINCEVGEDVHFYEKCIDASNFSWSFDPNASLASSTLPEPQNDFWSNSLPQPVELICWSNNGCYDTVVKDGPRVVDLPVNIDSVWVNANKSPNTPIDPLIIDMVSTSDGYIIVGRYNDETFGSRFGDSTTMSGIGGGYLMKYDFRGMLKWKVESDGIIKNIAIDDSGNIVFAAEATEYFVDNKNDTTFLTSDFQGWGSGVLVKLDSLGRHIWDVSSNFCFPEKVYFDNSGNIVVSFILGGPQGWQAPLYYNGVVTGGILESKGTGNRRFCVVKFDPNGSLTWQVMMNMSYVNIAHIAKITFDSTNNVYVAGTFEGNLMTFPTNLPDSVVTPFYASSTGGTAFITKLDSLGQFAWQTRGYSVGNGSNAIRCTDMVTDAAGNSYLTGRNPYFPALNGIQTFENVNGTLTTNDRGQYYFMRVNTHGNCDWIKTGDFSSFGEGNKLTLDNENRIYATAWVGETGSITWSTMNFSNDDGSTFVLSRKRPHYFIAEYDSTGYIHSMFENSSDVIYAGTTTFFYPYSAFPGFFKHSDGTFYVARNVELQPGTSYDEFGIPMSTSGMDTWVVKCRPEDGISVPMVYFSEIDTVACSGANYQLPNGNVIVVSSNISDTTLLVAQNGSDSTVITNISIVSSINYTQNVQACSGSTVTYPDGTSEVITSSTSYVSSFVATTGCDSLITTNVTLIPDPSATINDSVCIGETYSFDDGTSLVIDSATVYSYTDVTSTGCDSTTTVNIEVFPPLSPSVSQIDTILMAVPSNQNGYQWVLCDTQADPIIGETGVSFTPDNSGYYAVIVNDGNCSDTSDCVYYALNNLAEEAEFASFLVSPNPTEGTVIIGFSGFQQIDVVLSDIHGRRVKRWDRVEDGDQLSFTNLAQGVYILMSNKHRLYVRVVKQ